MILSEMYVLKIGYIFTFKTVLYRNINLIVEKFISVLPRFICNRGLFYISLDWVRLNPL